MTMLRIAVMFGLCLAWFSPAFSADAQNHAASILVRGHWVIEVSNPDGTSAARREFDNHLDPAAGFIFNCLFTRDCALGLYSIEFSTSTTSGYPGPFGNNGGPAHNQPVSGFISESTHNGPVPAGTLEHPASNNQGGFVLAGTTTAAVAGWITDVSTRFSSCARSTRGDTSQPNGTAAPSDCDGSRKDWDLKLTTRSIAPLHLEAGQVVNVKVNISFASAPPPSLVF